MKKKFQPWQIIAMIILFAGAFFLCLSIFTNINDALFLPLALFCVLVANIMQLIVQRKYKEK